LCQFVGDSVGNVGSGSGSAVRTENDTVLEVDGHAMVRLEGVRRGRNGEKRAPAYSHRGSQARRVES
jgi:hypothetical protein